MGLLRSRNKELMSDLTVDEQEFYGRVTGELSTKMSNGWRHLGVMRDVLGLDTDDDTNVPSAVSKPTIKAAALRLRAGLVECLDYIDEQAELFPTIS